MRITSGSLDIAPIVLYFPVKYLKEGQRAFYIKTIELLCSWQDGVISGLPSRCTPIIMMGLNDRILGMWGDEQTNILADFCDEHGPQDACADLALDVMVKHSRSAAQLRVGRSTPSSCPFVLWEG